MAKANGQQDLKLQSLADVGYQQGKTESRIVEIAKFAMTRIATLGDLDSSRDEQMNKEQRDELKQGYMTYFNEAIRAPRYFKPEAFYKMVEEITVGRRLDYFSRQRRDGWDSFGNETSKF